MDQGLDGDGLTAYRAEVDRLSAERDRYREALEQARDLLAEAYDEAEHDDSPGNMAFAVLSAALSRKATS